MIREPSHPVADLIAPETVDAPGGDPEGLEVRLPDATVEIDNEFATVWLVTMDGRPLSESGKMLLQGMTEQRNHGYQTEGSPQKEIRSVGQAPVEVREISGTVTLRRTDAAKLNVTALDSNGVPMETLPAAKSIQLLPNRLYYLIEARSN